MNSGSVVLAASVILGGCIVLRGINLISAVIKAIVWSLYRATAVTSALAKTCDVPYLRLEWEYRTAVADVATQRAVMLKAEEQRLAAISTQPYAFTLRRLPIFDRSDELPPASGVRQGG